MKATGIVRKIDDLGRIVLPIELRRVLNVADREALEIFTEGDSIILKKYQPGCVFCSSVDDVKTINGVGICSVCAGNIESLYRGTSK